MTGLTSGPSPDLGPAIAKIALGTVQFGLDYGIANRSGQVSPATAAAILDFAYENGIDMLDTAIAYGTSETVLGQSNAGRFKLVTKLPRMPSGIDVGKWVADEIAAAMHRLQVDQLYGLLLHHPADLAGDQGGPLFQALEMAKRVGCTEKIGISIYEPGTLDAFARFKFDLVQAPLNLFDQRLVRSGWLARLQEEGTEVHARSAFLQGLLLLPAEQRPAAFDHWKDIWTAWDEWLRVNGLTPLQACLGFALSVSGVSRVVVGVDGVNQLQEIVALATAKAELPDLPQSLIALPPQLISPAAWPNARP